MPSKDPVSRHPHTQFTDEFLEVFGDLHMDYSKTMLDFDPEVGHRTQLYVTELIRLGSEKSSDPREVIRSLMSGMLWMFMAGREHARRGYGAPVASGDEVAGWVPGSIAQLFGGDDDAS